MKKTRSAPRPKSSPSDLPFSPAFVEDFREWPLRLQVAMLRFLAAHPIVDDDEQSAKDRDKYLVTAAQRAEARRQTKEDKARQKRYDAEKKAATRAGGVR